MSHNQEALEAARARLDEFAAEVGGQASNALLSKDGAPSREVMDFRKQHGLTLDWMYCGVSRKFQDAGRFV